MKIFLLKIKWSKYFSPSATSFYLFIRKRKLKKKKKTIRRGQIGSGYAGYWPAQARVTIKDHWSSGIFEHRAHIGLVFRRSWARPTSIGHALLMIPVPPNEKEKSKFNGPFKKKNHCYIIFLFFSIDNT